MARCAPVSKTSSIGICYINVTGARHLRTVEIEWQHGRRGVDTAPSYGSPMSTSIDYTGASTAPATGTTAARRGRWIDHWEPENEQFWETTGKRIARKNLALSIFAEHLGFSVWVADKTPSTQMAAPLGSAATAGIGGGNFSSSMANISFFYPEKRKGFALGLNAAGGNLGVAVAQLLVPLALIVGVPAAAVKLPEHHVHLAYAGLMWLPLIVVAAVCAWLYMDSLTQARADTRSYVKALRHGQTWVMSILYIGTFGSFIGYSFALPLVIKNTFPEFLGHHPFIATYLAGLGFMGALIGSLSRPLGGWMSDKLGGARVTLACFLGMALFTGIAMIGVRQHSFATFFASYMAIFLFAGMGNGSTYRMIPSIFAALGRKEADEKGLDPEQTALDFKRRAAATIGICGAVGAFGGFLIQLVFRQSSLGVSALMKAAKTPAEKAAIAQSHLDWSVSALWVFIVGYVVFAGMTWFFYMRKSFATDRVPSLAYASV